MRANFEIIKKIKFFYTLVIIFSFLSGCVGPNYYTLETQLFSETSDRKHVKTGSLTTDQLVEKIDQAFPRNSLLKPRIIISVRDMETFGYPERYVDIHYFERMKEIAQSQLFSERAIFHIVDLELINAIDNDFYIAPHNYTWDCYVSFDSISVMSYHLEKEKEKFFSNLEKYPNRSFHFTNLVGGLSLVFFDPASYGKEDEFRISAVPSCVKIKGKNSKAMRIKIFKSKKNEPFSFLKEQSQDAVIQNFLLQVLLHFHLQMNTEN